MGAGDEVGADDGLTVGDPEGINEREGESVGDNDGDIVGVAVVGIGVGTMVPFVAAGASVPTGKSVMRISGTKDSLN